MTRNESAKRLMGRYQVARSAYDAKRKREGAKGKTRNERAG